MSLNAPAYISHTVLVHAGSYRDFLTKLTTNLPQLQIKFVKKVSIHYYILQLEDHSAEPKGISKKEIYQLPLMAFREEFSSFIFFKTIKAYNNVLKRMCGAPDNKDANYDLVQNMLTPFEKSVLLDLENAKSIGFETEDETTKLKTSTTIYSKEEINSMKTLNKIFSLNKVKIDGEEKDLTSIVKDKYKWTIGVH